MRQSRVTLDILDCRASIAGDACCRFNAIGAKRPILSDIDIGLDQLCRATTDHDTVIAAL